MNHYNINLQTFFVPIVFLFSLSNFAIAEDGKIDAVTDQLQIIA